uniref:C-type lectin domain-containing protein n=1 Tax=Periophthalmus magnuspinnatus TaxID=409849 RepID=A0A3B3Z9J7_9GOBI
MTDKKEPEQKQNKLRNKTMVELLSQDVAATRERTKLMEKIDNLTSTNVYLTEEYSKVVQVRIDQEETMVNMSRIIADLSTFNSELQEGKQKLEEASIVLHDVNQKLQNKLMKEREKHQGILGELRSQNQNVTSALEKQRTDLNQCKEELKKMSAKLQCAVEAYHSLDRYCPVVNQNTQGKRMCKKCAEGWTLFQSKCYYFSSRTLSWSSSRAWCQTHRADLVIINSEEEQVQMDQTNTRLWIGMSDIEQEGDWRWVDGRQVTSNDWTSEDIEGEDCGHVDTSEEVLQAWMDGSCKISYRWICEMNV